MWNERWKSNFLHPPKKTSCWFCLACFIQTSLENVLTRYKSCIRALLWWSSLKILKYSTRECHVNGTWSCFSSLLCFCCWSTCHGSAPCCVGKSGSGPQGSTNRFLRRLFSLCMLHPSYSRSWLIPLAVDQFLNRYNNLPRLLLFTWANLKKLENFVHSLRDLPSPSNPIFKWTAERGRTPLPHDPTPDVWIYTKLLEQNLVDLRDTAGTILPSQRRWKDIILRMSLKNNPAHESFKMMNFGFIFRILEKWSRALVSQNSWHCAWNGSQKNSMCRHQLL